jgi:hypothetical protein
MACRTDVVTTGALYTCAGGAWGSEAPCSAMNGCDGSSCAAPPGVGGSAGSSGTGGVGGTGGAGMGGVGGSMGGAGMGGATTSSGSTT